MEIYTPKVSAQCWVVDTCTAPPSPARMSIKDESATITINACGHHAREAMRWGFRFKAMSRAVRVTSRVPDKIKTDARSRIAVLRYDTWTEIAEAPRDWCAHGCTIYAQRHGHDGISFALIHSSTYGCPLGG